NLRVLTGALRTERLNDASFVLGLQLGNLEQEGFTAQRRDLRGDLIDFTVEPGQGRENARALLQVQRPETLQVAPYGDALAGRLGRHAIDQHTPAQRLAALYSARLLSGSHLVLLAPQCHMIRQLIVTRVAESSIATRCRACRAYTAAQAAQVPRKMICV